MKTIIVNIIAHSTQSTQKCFINLFDHLKYKPHVCHCGVHLDALGVHRLACKRRAGKHPGYGRLNDVIWRLNDVIRSARKYHLSRSQSASSPSVTFGQLGSWEDEELHIWAGREHHGWADVIEPRLYIAILKRSAISIQGTPRPRKPHKRLFTVDYSNSYLSQPFQNYNLFSTSCRLLTNVFLISSAFAQRVNCS